MKQYEDLFDTPEDDVKAGMALQLGVEAQPDQAAKDELLAKRYQLPPGMVSTYRADYENKAKFDDAMSVVEQSPKLRSWIAADPLRAKVTHDDLKSLDEAEKQYGAIKPVERSLVETVTEPLQRGYARFKKGVAQTIEEVGFDAGLDEQKAAAKAAHGMQYNPEAEQAFTLSQYQRSIERLPMPPEIAQGLQEISEAEGFVDAFKSIVSNPFSVIEVTLESIGMAVPTMAAGVAAAVVGPAGPSTLLPFLSYQALRQGTVVGIGSFLTEYSATMDEVLSSSGKDMKDPNNVYQALTNPIMMEAAREKAVKRGVPIAFFDALTAGLAGKLISGAKPTATSVSSRVAGELGLQAAGGAAGEATAQALTGEYKPGEILLEAIAELPTALVEAPLNYRETMTMARQAEANAQRIETIAQISAASKVRERDAGMFKDWIEQVTADNPVQNVYISANVLNQSGLAQQVVEASPVVAEQYEKALQIGGEIEIPISEYMTNIAPTEASVALIDDLRVEGENMTRREATQFIDQATQEYQQLVQEQVEKQMTNDEFRKSAGEVETAMFQQIKSAGRYTDEAARIQAQFVRNFFATQATQMRMLPMDLYRASPYSVVTEGQRVFNQSLPDLTRELVQTPEFQNWFGDSVVADADGTPQLMYHGTSANITEFLAGKDGVIYVSPDTSFAQTFSRYSNERMLRDLALSLDEKPDEKMAILEPIIDDAMARGDLTSATFPYHQQLAKAGFLKDLDKFTKEYWMDRYRDLSIRDAMGSVGIGKQVTEALAAQLPTAPNILPLYVSAKNPFDYENEKHVNALTKKIIANNPDDYRSRLRKELLSDDIKKGNWKAIEGTDALDAMKELGFDSFYVSEQGVKNLGLFNSEQVKSPFNEGSWSTDTANILKQRLVPEQEVTLSDEINVTTDDVSDDAAGEISQADIPTAVDDVAVLESALNVARGQTWNKGRDLKQAIQDAVQAQAQAAGVDVSVPSDQTTDYLIRVGVRDALFALQQNPNAIGWYDEKTRQALAVMSLIHPEIAKDEDAKFAFVWALAVTSNGMKVNENFKLAESAYEYYKTNKRMPTNIRAGQAQGSINKSMRLFNQLVDNWGMDNLRKFMQTNFTVGEIASINKRLKPGGEHADVIVKGASILGPKIGNGFFSNLYGDFTSLTMDRWLVRTWGRWTGTLIKSMPNQTKAAEARLTAAVTALNDEEAKALGDIVGSGINTTNLEKLANAIQKSSMDPEARARLNQSEKGQELRKAGNSLAKYLDGQKEAPAGPHERKYIRSVFNAILTEIQSDPQYADMTMADMQAVLWYAEKRLYETAKDDNVDQETTDGYAEEDAPDYANAAAAVAREKGISPRRINNALKKESRDERSRLARQQDPEGQVSIAGEPIPAGGFASRQKRLFAGAVATRIARSNRGGPQEQSWSYTGTSSGDSGKARVLKNLGVTYRTEWNAGRSLKNIYSRNGINAPRFVELDSTNPANADAFVLAITKAKQAQGEIGAAVYVYPVDEYRGMRLFLAEDGLSGVAIKPDGDIVSVFATNGSGRSVMELAVKAGGRKLDAFETILPEFYAAHGFVGTSKIAWDDGEAPEGWSKQAFAEFNNGEPAVAFMAYDPSYFGWYDAKQVKQAKTYDDAVAKQNREVKAIAKRKDQDGKPAIFNQLGPGPSGAQPLRAGDLAVQQRYGTPITNATSVVGVHYSRQPRTSLAGGFFGTGITGAERNRLAESADDRIRQRIYFYVDTGAGIRPEDGVGGNVHAVNLDNLYNISEDPYGFIASAKAMPGYDQATWFNSVESMIIDAGFDGVYVPEAQGNQGVAVLLGPKHSNVSVEQFGQHMMPPSGMVQKPDLGQRSYSLLSSEIRQYSENEEAIKAVAPSVRLKDGSLIFDVADTDNLSDFFPNVVNGKPFRQEARGGFDPTNLTTILYKDADLSTFLHETAHFFLTTLAQFASSPQGSEQQKQDMQTLLDWLGVKDLETWNNMSLEQQRNYHEQFAYSYELYLFEGKAPSLKLQALFDRFSAWINQVYKSIKNELNAAYRAETGKDLPVLTGEVKGVMDRMLASSEQIEQAERVRNMLPMFQTQQESGMNDAEWAAYQEMVDEATTAAKADLTNATLRQMKWLSNAKSRVLKDLQQQANEARQRIEAEVEAELEQTPIYAAMNYLKTGKTVNSKGEVEQLKGGYKLSIDTLVGMYGTEGDKYALLDWSKLGFGKYGMASQDGIAPDIVASMFGVPSGDALVRQLLDAPKFNDEVKRITDQRMLERYGELVDQRQIDIAVERAVHNEARTRFVAVELRHLAKATQPARLMMQAAKLAAQNLLRTKTLKEIKPREFSIAEARASKESTALMKKGDSIAAGRQKQIQLLNNQMATEALKANAEVAKALDVFKKVFGSDKKLSPSRDMNMVAAARAILSNYGLGKTDQAPSAYLEKVRAYDPDFYAEIEPLITAQTQNPKPFNSLTLDEFRDIRDQVFALWHLSKRTKQSEIDGKKIDRKEIVDQLLGKMEKLDTGKARAGYERAMSDWDKQKIRLMGFRASLRRVESWADAMDGGDPQGPFRRFIWNPVSEAITQYRLKKVDYLQKYLDLIKTVEKDLTGGSIDAHEFNYAFKDKAELLHAVIHTGNSSNKRKLLLGRNWASVNEDGTLNTERWDAFLERMYREQKITKVDYDFVQAVWDLMEDMKPAAQKAHYDMYGFYFDEITAEPVITPFGVYRGGYAPAVTDPWIVTEAAVAKEQELTQADNSYMFPTTGRGFTKGRVEYNKPLMLDLGFLPSHIDKVMRFTYVEPRIKDVARIVKTNKEFGDAMDKIDPTIRIDMLIPWLQRSATQQLAAPMRGRGGEAINKFFNEVRNRTGMQLMVANITNALQQITGLSLGAVAVRPKYLRDALWTYTKSPALTMESVGQKSDFMKTRLSNQQFEIAKTIEQMLLNPSKYEKLRDFSNRHGYFMQQGLQNLVDTIVWTGAYNESYEKNASEKQAIRDADAAVRLTQGSFAPEDVSRFETGNAFIRLFTQFYSYFNMQANLLGTEFVKVARNMGISKGKGRLFYTYVFGFMIPAVMAEVIVQGARGFDVGDDDDEWDMYDGMSLFFGSQARTLAGMVPIAGPAVTAGFNAWNDKPYDDRISTSPTVSVLETVIRTPQSVYKAVAEEGSVKKAVRDLLISIGMITGLPLGQLGKPVGYLIDVQEGEAQPESAMDVVRGLMSGRDVNAE